MYPTLGRRLPNGKMPSSWRQKANENTLFTRLPFMQKSGLQALTSRAKELGNQPFDRVKGDNTVQVHLLLWLMFSDLQSGFVYMNKGFKASEHKLDVSGEAFNSIVYYFDRESKKMDEVQKKEVNKFADQLLKWHKTLDKQFSGSMQHAQACLLKSVILERTAPCCQVLLLACAVKVGREDQSRVDRPSRRPAFSLVRIA
jgi:hypothetical protein